MALLIPLRCQLELDWRQRHLLASGGARASVSLSVSLSSHFLRVDVNAALWCVFVCSFTQCAWCALARTALAATPAL